MDKKDFLKRAIPVLLSPSEDSFFWMVDLSEIQEKEVIEAKSFLDKATLNKSMRLIFKEFQNRSIITHALLRFYLGQFIKEYPQEIEMLYSDFGKPYLLNHPIHFNLSHTKHYAFFGFHLRYPLGVDIEVIQQNWDFIKTSDISRDLTTEPPGYSCSLWCAQEALLKAIGSGFLINQIPSLYPVQRCTKDSDFYISTGLEVYVYHEKIPGHKLAVCIKKDQGFKMEFRQIHPQLLL